MTGIKPRVLVIGLDGATFDLIKPWANDGHLPNLKRFMDEGSHGNLESTLPPVTAPAWASMITGKNPAGHGCFDFTKQVDKTTGHVEIVSSKTIRSETIWSMLSEAGIKVGAVNVPMTYPPQKVNGFIVSGMLSPNNRGSSYPEELIEEMATNFRPYRVDVVEHFLEGKEKAFLEDILTLTQEREESALWLMRNRPWDFFFVVFRATDHAIHYYWKYMDRNHPQYMGENNGFSDAILRCYKRADEAVGNLVEEAGLDTHVIIVSDHGAGPLHRTVNINIFLRDRGFLELKKTFRTTIKKAMFSVGVSPHHIYKTLKRLHLGTIVSRRSRGDITSTLSTKFLSFDDVDWGRTKAYSRGYLGQIYINTKKEEYDQVRQHVIDALREMKDPRTGTIIVSGIVKKEDTYSGPMFESAPDLIVIMQDYRYISYPLFASSNSLTEPQIEGSSGSHRQKGIFIAAGPDIKSGEMLEGLGITDICPTILHMYGLPVREDMDGKVLSGIFRDGSDFSSRAIKFQQLGEEDKLKKSIGRFTLSKKI